MDGRMSAVGEFLPGSEFEFTVRVSDAAVSITVDDETATFNWTEVFPEDAIPDTGNGYTLYATFREDVSMKECRIRREVLRQFARNVLRPQRSESL